MAEKYKYLSDAGLSLPRVWAWAKELVRTLNQGDSNSNTAGQFMYWPTEDIPVGWLLCDGSQVKVDDYKQLFVAIGYRYGGADGLFNLPDLRNKLLMGAGTLVGLNQTAGADQITLTVDQMPTHTHVVDDPKHVHTFTADPHTHGVTDPGHTHGVTDPGHHHSGGVGATGTATAAGTTGPTVPANTGDAATGITINSAMTGITNQPVDVTGTTDEAETGITNEETGGSQAFSVLNPVFGVNILIKA